MGKVDRAPGGVSSGLGWAHSCVWTQLPSWWGLEWSPTDDASLLRALPSSSRPAWERSQCRGRDPRKQVVACKVSEGLRSEMSGHHFTVNRSKSQNQIHRIKKWVLLSERRGRSDCSDPGWRKLLVLFANKIPPQQRLLSHYPVTLQVGPGGCFLPHFRVKEVWDAK